MEYLCSRRRRAVHRLGQAAARTCWNGPAARDPRLVVHGDEPSERLEDVRMGGPAPPRGYGAGSARDGGVHDRHAGAVQAPARLGVGRRACAGADRVRPAGTGRCCSAPAGRGSAGEPALLPPRSPGRRAGICRPPTAAWASRRRGSVCAAGSGREAAEATAGRLASGDAHGERGRGAVDGGGVPEHGIRATAERSCAGRERRGAAAPPRQAAARALRGRGSG